MCTGIFRQLSGHRLCQMLEVILVVKEWGDKMCREFLEVCTVEEVTQYERSFCEQDVEEMVYFVLLPWPFQLTTNDP